MKTNRFLLVGQWQGFITVDRCETVQEVLEICYETGVSAQVMSEKNIPEITKFCEQSTTGAYMVIMDGAAIAATILHHDGEWFSAE